MNLGYAYRSTVPPDAHHEPLADFLARRYPHSSRADWVERIADGLVQVEGKPARPEQPLEAGTELCWHRPPWRRSARLTG